jgi:CARDB
MDAKNLLLRWSVLTLLGLLLTAPLTSCSYCVPHQADRLCDLIKEAPLKELTSSEPPQVVFEEQGTIIVYHGVGCAESKKSGREDVLKVEQSLDLPPYATNATIFLNGWRVRYLNKDHHIAGLGTTIENIRLERNTLKWQAAGVLSDDNFNDAYRWCYNYTVVAWSPSNLNLIVDHEGGSCGAGDPSQANSFGADNDGTTTALSSFSSFLQNPDFTAGMTVAILPRGFGFGWDCGDDHHLIQIGYNLDHSETFIENGKKYKKLGEVVVPSLPNNASQVDSGFVSWETSVIFKDNKERRDYGVGEIVSGLGGNDVGVIQPPFSSLPEEDRRFCTGVGSSPQSQEFIIEKVLFEFAIPMLTGWELSYPCNDEHVTEGGIWIDEWGFDRTTRTLQYKLSSVLRDQDSDPGHRRRHKVTILGLRPVAGVSDLVPFSPAGDSADAFCRMEQDRRELRVTVKNQGNADASASRTTVTFGDIPVTVNTPVIPAGGSVDLLFKVPTNCIGPDCSFKITVDSNNQVNESNNEGNNSANGRCIG